MTQTLEQIVEEAWRLFDVAHPGSHQACKACCMSADHNHEFLAVPARELSLDFLNGWFLSVFYDPASPALARYLLPRLMQATVQGEDLVYGLEMALCRLRTGDGDFWTPPEKDLITRYRQTFLDAMRGTAREDMLDDVLGMFVDDGHNPIDLLDQIWAWSDRDLVERLHKDWCSFGKRQVFFTHVLYPDHRAMLYDWYVSPSMQDRLLELCVNEEAPTDLREKAERVLNCIAAD